MFLSCLSCRFLSSREWDFTTPSRVCVCASDCIYFIGHVESQLHMTHGWRGEERKKEREKDVNLGQYLLSERALESQHWSVDCIAWSLSFHLNQLVSSDAHWVHDVSNKLIHSDTQREDTNNPLLHCHSVLAFCISVSLSVFLCLYEFV